MGLKEQYQALYKRKLEAKSKGDGSHLPISLEVRSMERELARGGIIGEGGKIIKEDLPTKRDRHIEYINRFDDKTPVKISDASTPDGAVMTLREYHKRRLLGGR